MAMKNLELNSTSSSVSVFSLETSGKLFLDSSTSCPCPASNVTYVDLYLHSRSVSAVFVVSYLLIFIMCMFGNGMVCFVVLRRKNMRTVTNLFILNLAFSDLLVGIFCMPTTLVDNIITGWPFGSLVCKLSGMVQGISVSASVFTLVAIAVDRFRCIIYPFKQKLTTTTSTLIIAVIWVLAVSIMCPSGFMLQVTMERQIAILLVDGNSTQPFYWCHENWPNKEMRKIYTTVLFVSIYLGPLTLIVIMYARIGFTLFKTASPIAANQESSTSFGSESKKTSSYEPRQTASRKKKHVVKMLLVVALLFILSWLPLWTLMMLTDYASLNEFQHRVINIYVYPLAHWLAFCNSSINPIIYGFFNENFRRGFQAAFKLQLCSDQQNNGRTYVHRVQRNAVLPTGGGSNQRLETFKKVATSKVRSLAISQISEKQRQSKVNIILEDLETVHKNKND